MEEDAEAAEDRAALADARRQVVLAAIENDPLLSLKDAQECSPLHLAILNGGRGRGRDVGRCVTRALGKGGGMGVWGGATACACLDAAGAASPHSVKGRGRVRMRRARRTRPPRTPAAAGRGPAASVPPSHVPRAPRPRPAQSGSVECVRILIAAKARLATACDGCPPLIMAACTAAVRERRGPAAEIIQLLLGAGADVLQR
jgi:hypothetical protein